MLVIIISIVFFIVFVDGLHLNTKCDSNLPFCYPLSNTTWFEYDTCEFIWNRNYTFYLNNNTTSVDLYLLHDNIYIKEWRDILLSEGILSVEVTNDWFPAPLEAGTSNRSWAFDVMAFDHAKNDMNFQQPTMKIQVIQLAPLETERHGSAKWVIAVIIIGGLGVVVAVACLIWIWRHMHNKKRQSSASSDLDEKSAGNPHMQHHHASSSILSLDDAKRLANSYRQVLSTSDIDKKRIQIGEDILRRNLEAEGTRIIEVGHK